MDFMLNIFLLTDSMHLTLLNCILRSQWDLGAGQFAARSWVSQLEHQH